MEKKCTKCKIVKPLSEFYKNRTKSDGHDVLCRDCRKALYKPKNGRKPIHSIEDYTMQELLDEVRRRQEQTPNS